jgi:hypothetical protein
VCGCFPNLPAKYIALKRAVVGSSKLLVRSAKLFRLPLRVCPVGDCIAVEVDTGEGSNWSKESSLCYNYAKEGRSGGNGCSTVVLLG